LATLAYISDQRFYRDCDGYWYTTASFPLAALATFMPNVDRILIVGRMEQLDYMPKDLYHIVLPSSAKVEFRGIFNFGSGARAYLKHFSEYTRYLSKAVADADIVWLKLPFVASLVAAHYANRESQLIVAQMVGDPVQGLVRKKGMLWCLPAAVAGALSKEVMSLVHIPVFVSRYLATRHGTGLREIHVFNENRITLDMIRAIDRSELHDPIKLLYVGRLSPEKGLDVLLEALATLVSDYSCNAMLTVVGSGDSRAELERLADRLDIRDHILFVGRVAWGDELFNIMLENDVFVLPSYTEGLGLVLLEAMSHSLPVVATRVGGIPEIVSDQESGILVMPGDSNGLAAAIFAVITNDVLRLKLIESGLRVARQQCFEMQTGELAKMIDERTCKVMGTSH